MPIFTVRKVGNSLGLVFPRDYVQRKGLRPNEPVRVDVEPVQTLDDVKGSLARYGLSTDEWNDATNEGEEL